MFVLPLAYIEPLDDWPAWIVALLFFTPLTGGLFIYFYFTRHARSWRKGIFPKTLKPTEDNLLEAFLAIGAKLMLLNYEHSKSKIQFINSYFNRYFTKSNYNFGDSLLFSLRYPIHQETVIDWYKLHWKTTAERSQLLYFLVGLAVQTDNLRTRELTFLRAITRGLELPENLLERIVAMYVVNQKERLKKEKHTVEPQRLRADCLVVLGLQEGASPEEIKKAYRKMAKIHHPDRLTQASASQRKLAEEKFIQIQQAYEVLSQ